VLKMNVISSYTRKLTWQTTYLTAMAVPTSSSLAEALVSSKVRSQAKCRKKCRTVLPRFTTRSESSKCNTVSVGNVAQRFLPTTATAHHVSAHSVHGHANHAVRVFRAITNFAKTIHLTSCPMVLEERIDSGKWYADLFV
jgi:hypothetical protein